MFLENVTLLYFEQGVKRTETNKKGAAALDIVGLLLSKRGATARA